MDLPEDVDLDGVAGLGEGSEGEGSDGEIQSSREDSSSEVSSQEPEEPEDHYFDITLAATHSYMGGELSAVGGRVVPEAGWEARVPALAHAGVVFPGETVPMLLMEPHDAAALARALQRDKLFGLLSPDVSRRALSGFGTLCEVFEAALGAGRPPASISFKARALNRFRVKNVAKEALSPRLFDRVREVHVVVLPELVPEHPLRHARPACLDARRPPDPALRAAAAVRRLDAAVSPWPHFVYDIVEYSRMRALIADYFRTMDLERMLPREPVALSFWVASNLPLSPRDRLALFKTDNALTRLFQECNYITKKGVVCCVSCGTALARREDVLAMSSSGAHGNYTNPGGVLHGVLTVARARHTRLAGAPERHYSWFPGYLWTVALCGGCNAHVGWRFSADGAALRPRRFYGLCRTAVAARAAPAPH